MKLKNRFFIVVLLIFFLLPLFSQGAQEMHAIFEGTKSDDVGMVLKSIYFLDREVARIDADHDLLWEERVGEIEDSYRPLFETIDAFEPEIWETDAEFEQRRDLERLHLQEEMDRDINRDQLIALEARDIAKQPFENWLSVAEDTLALSRTIPPEQFSMEPLEYQRNERVWPIRYQSTHALVPFEDITIYFDFKYLNADNPENMKQHIIDIDNAIKTDNMFTEFYWEVYKQGRNRFIAGVSSTLMENLLTGKLYSVEWKELKHKNTYEVVGDTYGSAYLQRVD